MIKQKSNGAYYTPEFLSKFMLKHVSNYFNNVSYLSFLEPSIGDGSFAKAFNETVFPTSIKQFSFTAVEKIKPELKKAENIFYQSRKKNTKVNFTRQDFLKYQANVNRKYSLIAGNPPYIKKGLLKKNQINACERIHQSAGLSNITVKNLWSAFLIRCSQLLNDNGVLAFVLPAELLQVNFSNDLRNYLINIFERVEIFTFNELIFECKGQDTILLFGFKKHKQPGQFYTYISNLKFLEDCNFTSSENKVLIENGTKWTHHILTSDELSFIYNLSSNLKTVRDYCDTKPGIVTAANKFFIINESTKRQYNLDNYCKPIIEKALYVNGSVVFNEKDYKSILLRGLSTNVLCFTDDAASRLPNEVKDYIDLGEGKNIHKGYKCSKRNNWFVIPNISEAPEGFFFRRTHLYPKLIKNESDVLVTDSAYQIRMKDGHNINNLIYGFYNSLTLIFSELLGRYYGGGLLELTPNEFKKIPLIDVQIQSREFDLFVGSFEKKTSIDEVLEINDSLYLSTALSLSKEECLFLNSIYKKLIDKRFRRPS